MSEWQGRAYAKDTTRRATFRSAGFRGSLHEGPIKNVAEESREKMALSEVFPQAADAGSERNDCGQPNAIAQARASSHVACSNLFGGSFDSRSLILLRAFTPLRDMPKDS